MLAKTEGWNQLRIPSARKMILCRRLKGETLLPNVYLIYWRVKLETIFWVFQSSKMIGSIAKDGSDGLVMAQSIPKA